MILFAIQHFMRIYFEVYEKECMFMLEQHIEIIFFLIISQIIPASLYFFRKKKYGTIRNLLYAMTRYL